MKQTEGLIFFANVTDGEATYSVDISSDLAESLSQHPQILSITQALSLGIDLSQVTKTEGVPLLCNEELLRLRKMNAISNNELKLTADGKYIIPTLESLRERAKASDKELALTFWETVPESKSNYCSIEASDTSATNIVADCLPVLYFGPQSVNVINTATRESESTVYIPFPAGNEKYLKDQAVEAGSTYNAAELAEIVKATCKLYLHEHTLYVFDNASNVYRPLFKDDLNLLIDKILGRNIRTKGFSGLYADIAKFLHCDSTLLVPESCLPTANMWAFSNGILDIDNSRFFINDGSFFIRNTLACDYNSHAQCSIFDKYLIAVTGGDQSLTELIWSVIGYILSPDINAKAFFALVGPKDTGKSLFANTLARFFTPDSLSYLGANDFSGKFSVVDIMDKRLNLCMDLPDAPLSTIAVGKIKSLTGNDSVRSDVKYKNSVSFRNTAKILFGSNSLIRTEVPDSAFADRLITIPFNHPIPKEKQDKNLEQSLASEMSGIINHAIAAYLELRAQNYIFPLVTLSETLASVFDYRKIVTDFANIYCIFTESEKDKISTECLYQYFCDFCYAKSIAPLKLGDFSQVFHNLFRDSVTKKKIKYLGSPVNGYTRLKLQA